MKNSINNNEKIKFYKYIKASTEPHSEERIILLLFFFIKREPQQQLANNILLIKSLSYFCVLLHKLTLKYIEHTCL